MSGAPSPLVYLRRRELVNTLRLALRSRRHRAGLLLFLLLLAVLIGEPLLLVFGRSNRGFGAGLALIGARAALSGWFVLHSLQWVRAALSERVLLLPQAHYDFLFPAPISRRSLVVNHLLSSYVPFLWGSPTMALPIVAAAGAWFPDYQPIYFAVTVATFLLFDLAAFNLTTLIAVLARGGTADVGTARSVQRGVLAAALVVAVGLVLWRALGGEPRLVLSAAPRLFIAPFFLLADLVLSPVMGLPSWGPAALALLAAVAVGSLLLLVDRFAAASEPGHDAAARQGGTAAGATWTRGLWVFQAEAAIAWKTLLALRRSGGRLLLVVGVGMAGLAAGALVGSPRLLFAAGPAAFFLYYSLLAETLFAIFVADLERMDLLLPLPLRPWRILVASMGVLIAVGILAGWVALVPAWFAYGAEVRQWLGLAAAELPLVVPLVFLSRGTLTVLFPPQREAETLDLMYAAAVELAVLVLNLVVVALPVVGLIVAIVLGASLLGGWLVSAAMALPLIAALGWALLVAYRRRGPSA